jgi:hypothetical protein
MRIEHSMMEFFQPDDYRIVMDVMMRRYREYFQHHRYLVFTLFLPQNVRFLTLFFSLMIERKFRGKKRVKPKMTRVSVLGSEAIMKILK